MIQAQPKTEVHSSLTDEQQRVVLHDMTTPAKVIAVAGAGKTTTLISRIEHLLAQGVDPSHIGVFMFNKSAQEEFSERLSKRLMSVGHLRSPSVMTFHAFGMKFCRRLEQQGWLPSAKLVTDDFSLVKMLRESLQRLMRSGEKIAMLDEKDWLEDVLLFIDQVKASDLPASIVFDALGWSKERQFFPALYDELERLRKRNNMRFFADLLSDPYELLSELGEPERVRIRGLVPDFRYLLIDEFQDINPCQYELLKLLYPAPCQWMIVGDVQQCIYEWRGASPDIMATQFDKDFSKVITYPLSTSFRFGHAVGLMASSVISENDPDALVIGAGERTRVSFARAPKTGKALLGELKAWVDEGKALSDTAVLVRLYSDMVPVQLALMHKGVPYQLHGDSPLLENRQIRMLMAYLAVIAGGLEGSGAFFRPDDIEYLLTVPSLGASVAQRKTLIQQAKQSPHLLPQIIESVADATDGWRAKKLYERADWLRSLTMYRTDPAQGLAHTLEKLGVYRYFESTSSKDIQTQEKIATCDAFMAYVRGVGGDAKSILEQLATLNERHTDDSHGVHLMTIHKSKGLEFDQVLLSGLQEGRFPYYDEDLSAIDKQAATDLASERRLFYVAITRAKQKLVLLETPSSDEHKRMKLGDIPRAALKSLSLSRFVFEAQPYAVSRICEAWYLDANGEPIDTEKGALFQRYLNAVTPSPALTFRHRVEGKSHLKPGDKVRHDQFGQGVVVRQEQGEKQMIFVDFGEIGLKRFNPKHTQLVKLSSRT
ncbi:ATP-dependent helicase [Marinomonas profundimaris]|uniref:DNA 3'-5' helicase n=1 Tax=Marinomonas profundimaris TaxID=1208321 RepID=W1RYT2_9GAMM|nr:ATP-dependent helicase [Marinomonas profundimaris]ETI62117.1 UvrD/REP helicase [Marinomonas profundimaris]